MNSYRCFYIIAPCVEGFSSTCLLCPPKVALFGNQISIGSQGFFPLSNRAEHLHVFFAQFWYDFLDQKRRLLTQFHSPLKEYREVFIPLDQFLLQNHASCLYVSLWSTDSAILLNAEPQSFHHKVFSDLGCKACLFRQMCIIYPSSN